MTIMPLRGQSTQNGSETRHGSSKEKCVRDRTIKQLAVLTIVLASVSTLWAGDGTTPGTLRSYSTIYSIGIEWDISGDDNHNAAARIQYRAENAQSWKEALGLFRVDSRGCVTSECDEFFNMLSGSILFLKPGTVYDVKVAITDPDGGSRSETVTVKTRALPVLPEGGPIYHVVPGSGGGDGSEASPFRGIVSAEAKAAEGCIFLLHKGQYDSATFSKGGSESKYVAWKNAGDGEARFSRIKASASHLWLEGLTLNKAGKGAALSSNRVAKNVVLVKNTFSNFGYSILLGGSDEGWYIADNTIVGEKLVTIRDELNPRHTFSGEGVELSHTSGHTVAHNRISRTADAISYAHHNCDIFGNDIFDCTDDGIEPDYGYANIRMWENRIANCLMGVSFQPQKGGPWYIIRNQIVATGASLKFYFTVKGFVLVNNTLVGSRGTMGNALQSSAQYLLYSLSRNNLWILTGEQGKNGPSIPALWQTIHCTNSKDCNPSQLAPNFRTDVDYDGFDWGNLVTPFSWDGKSYADIGQFSAAVGIENNAIRVERNQIFTTFQVPDEMGNAYLVEMKYDIIDPQYMTLKPGCNAMDAGQALPNIAENYVGDAPDLGAHECGAAFPHYGPRHLPSPGKPGDSP
jgi:hypothetical protein